VSRLPSWVTAKSRSIPSIPGRSLSFAGLFSGCGGLDLGARLAGFSCLYAADNDSNAISTYRENIDPHAELVNLSTAPIERSIREVDLLLGGPPCQGFSSAGPKNADDPRNKLWKHYLDYVKAWKPKVFLMENVPGFRREFSAFAHVVESQLEGRYRLFSKRFIAQYFAVPQFRDRLIVQGVRCDVSTRPGWPEPTSDEIFSYTRTFPTAISMATALQDLGPPEVAKTSYFSDHWSIPLGKLDASIALHIPNGGSLKDIPDEHLPSPYNGRPRTNGGWTWYYRKPRPELPARGVIASIRANYATILAPDVRLKGKPGAWKWEPVERGEHTENNGYYTSPVQPRRLTMRECARLQTFPDWFRFHGSPLQVHRQIGNAVPVELARRLCEAVAKLIEQGDVAVEQPTQPQLF
jgi:DNA (cytosine-5)-methyltransferase 1